MSGERLIPQQHGTESGNALFDELDILLGDKPENPTYNGFRDRIALTEAEARVILFKDDRYRPRQETKYLGWGTQNAQSDFETLDTKIKSCSSENGSEEYQAGVKKADQYFDKFYRNYRRRFLGEEEARIRVIAASELLLDISFVGRRQKMGKDKFIVIKTIDSQHPGFASHQVINKNLLGNRTQHLW